MLDFALIVAGLLIVVVVISDLASTTISLSSVRGPLSSRVSEATWWLTRRLTGTPFEAARRGTGPLLVLMILVGWLAALTIGWTLVFTVDGALASAASPEQQSSQVAWIDALFFVSGTLVGRGSSGLEPDAAVWSTLVAMMSLTGVALLTLSLAWILPVVSAVVQKRSLAAQLSALGGEPEEIILRTWNGRDLGNLDLHLLPVVSELTLLAQRHLAFPVIHYFHTADHRTAVALRVAALDDALTLIDAAGLDDVERDTGLDRSTTRPLRQAITDYLETLQQVFISAEPSPPPPPSTAALVEAGIAEDGAVQTRVAELCEELAERRALMWGYVRHSGWEWTDVATDGGADRRCPGEDDD